MNNSELQADINNVPAGGTWTIPNGNHVITGLKIPKGIQVRNPYGVPLDARGMNTISNAISITAPDGDDVDIDGMILLGPEAGSSPVNDNLLGIDWSIYRHQNSRLTLNNVKITGLFGSAVQKAGGGQLHIHNCELNGWEAPWKFFGSHGEPGKAFITDSKLSATGGKYTSIGGYIHSHLSVLSARNTYRNLNRYGIYSNGGSTPPIDQFWVSENDTFENCSIAQTPLYNKATIINPNVSFAGAPQGSLIKGDLLIYGGKLGSELFTFDGNKHNVDFMDTIWEPVAIPLIIGGQGRYRFSGVTWNLKGSGRVFTTAGTSTAEIFMGDSVINDQGAVGPYMVQTQGPVTLDWGRAKIYTNRSDAAMINPKTKVIGAPTILPKQ